MFLKSIAPFAVMIALIVAVVVLTRAILQHRLKQRLAQSGLLNEQMMKDFFRQDGWPLEILKWCLLLFFGGLGLVVLQFVPFRADESPLPYGVESMFLSLGLGIYYFIVRKQQN